MPSEAEIDRFQEAVWEHYRHSGRPFPWRQTTNRYRILVSEVMLQQTQAERVVPYYRRFVATYPNTQCLAEARLPDVLALWQGLGYNRRARLLREAARQVCRQHHGRIPLDPERLTELPGIGPYTASAIAAFAGNRPEVVIETNIRSAILHHFFAGSDGVSDRQLAPVVAEVIDREAPREWYQALMDYGAMLKRQVSNPSRRSRHYSQQAPFAGSNRQLRGQVIKCLLAGPQTAAQLAGTLTVERQRLNQVLQELITEQLVVQDGRLLKLAD